MLVLALDTATTRITAGVVELPDIDTTSDSTPDTAHPDTTHPAPDAAPRTLARIDGEGARAHAELLAPAIRDALDAAGVLRTDLDAVVCGVGPGPFTGLRVGMVTAAVLGDGLGVPVHGVATHDALLHSLPRGVAALAVTDARRREVYWALGDGHSRVEGPAVEASAALAERLAGRHADRHGAALLAVGDAAPSLAELVDGLTVIDRPGPAPEGLVAVAADALRAGRPPEALVPLYLRRPDAVPPGAPKTVRR